MHKPAAGPIIWPWKNSHLDPALSKQRHGRTGMPAIRTFQGFFSYSHLDAQASPRLVEALTVDLEYVVSAKLLNGRFAIWRDTRNIRTADRWNSAIEGAIQRSDTLIVLLTPSWVESEPCRKEYLFFEKVEAGYGNGSYVAPILARSLGDQEKHLAPDQRAVYDSIRDRQYFKILASDFLGLDEDRRRATLEEIADDIVGILERRRGEMLHPAGPLRPSPQPRTAVDPLEHTRSIQDFEKVDFVTDDEVVIDRAQQAQARGVYAQVDFAERLCVEASNGSSVIFSVKQAYLTVENHGPGKLTQAENLRSSENSQNAFFVRLYDVPHAIAICIDPVTRKTGLGELALPPAPDENRLSRIATATHDVEVSTVKAELRVSLDAKGLYLPEGLGSKMPQSKRSQIKAIILGAARKRHHVTEAGDIRRPIEVRERDR
jgi:hypothetical protein